MCVIFVNLQHTASHYRREGESVGKIESQRREMPFHVFLWLDRIAGAVSYTAAPHTAASVPHTWMQGCLLVTRLTGERSQSGPG